LQETKQNAVANAKKMMMTLNSKCVNQHLFGTDQERYSPGPSTFKKFSKFKKAAIEASTIDDEPLPMTHDIKNEDWCKIGGRKMGVVNHDDTSLLPGSSTTKALTGIGSACGIINLAAADLEQLV
jgi:hypothetical protein